MAELSAETMGQSIQVEKFHCIIENTNCEQNRPHDSPVGHEQLAQCVTFEESRSLIREKFASYHQLISQKELELMSELYQLEAASQPELFHVKQDLKRLYDVIGTWDDTLGTNTLKSFLGRQKSIWEKEIQNFERSEKLLSHLKLRFSDFNQSIETIMEIVPYRTKAKFRTELKPLLKLKPKMGEEWFVLSQEWFSEFTAAINFYFPHADDSWEFPEQIPICTSSNHGLGQLALPDTQLSAVHSNTWELLLGFNGMANGLVPIKRRTYFDSATRQITVPLTQTKHKCHIGFNNGTNNIDIESHLETLPYETYDDILKRLSPLSELLTEHAPHLYSFDVNKNNVAFNPQLNNAGYMVSSKDAKRNCPTSIAIPIGDLSLQVGSVSKIFIIVIPDNVGKESIRVSCKN